jgi:AmmeMemoRadiSam system protein B
MEISNFLRGFTGRGRFSRAVVSPHAGWYYCGRLAARGISCLEPSVQTIAVLGGHLPAGHPPLFAPEDAAKTPFGPMPIDAELRSVLQKELDGKEDVYRDNTVEVLLPMVRYFFPDAMLLWLRLPAEMSSFEAGKKLAQKAAELNRKAAVIASTDLTHYGANYNFSPMGAGEAALKWVEEVNDANFIRAVESGAAEEALLHAGRDCSSCSPGAVLGAMGFALTAGLGNAKLLEYGTSADMRDNGEVPDSFVGYAAMAFV